MKRNYKRGMVWALLAVGSALAVPAVAHAQEPGSDIGSIFGQVQNAANAWIPTIFSAATRLFFLLASIDFAWSVPNLLREHDFMGLFQGIIKRLLVIGIFYGILVNGQTWIPAIVQSFVQIGSNATGLPSQMDPTDIMGRGIQICSDLLTKTQNANLLTQFGAVLATWFLVAIVFLSYGIITLHYVVTKLESIIVMSAGYLFLGFGGSRWTMPYFERYIALAISTGTRLMLIYLMLGVFQTVSSQWESTMSAWDPTQPIGPMFSEVAAMLLFAFAAWMIPKMAGSIASGSLGLGASDLLSVGGAAVAGTAAAAATVAAVSAAPFTGGASFAADAAMMGLEGAPGGEGVMGPAGMAESASTATAGTPGRGLATGTSDIMSGAAGVPANVPPPPRDAQMDIGLPSLPESTSAVAGEPHGDPSVSSQPATMVGADAQNPQAGAGESDREQEGRKFPAVPDDGAAHTPPPQLRVDREE